MLRLHLPWMFSVQCVATAEAVLLRPQVVSSRLQVTEGLLQKTIEEQGASEAIGDKLCDKAVCLMDDIAALVDR